MFSFRVLGQGCPLCGAAASRAEHPPSDPALDETSSGELDRWKRTAATLRLQLMLKDWQLRHLRGKYKAKKEEVAELDVAMQEERAAKISLQQHTVLRSAHRAASARRWKIVLIMTSVGFSTLVTCVPLLYQHLYGLMPSMRGSFWGAPGSACIVGFALATMAALPTDDAMIRICSVVAFMVQVTNTIVLNLIPILDFTGVYRPKYDTPVTGTITVWVFLFIGVTSLISVPMICSILRLRHGAKATSLAEVKHRVTSTFGRTAGVAALMLFFPVVWVAAQPSSNFCLGTRASYHRLWTITRGLVGMWGIAAGFAFVVLVLVEVPWDTNPAVPWTLFFATTALFLAAIGLSTPMRKRVHAWVSMQRLEPWTRSSSMTCSLFQRSSLPVRWAAWSNWDYRGSTGRSWCCVAGGHAESSQGVASCKGALQCAPI
jgi:hypothetical protein